MKDYRGIDISTLTVEDALGDEDWGRTPFDYFQYFAIPAEVLEGLPDFTTEEAGETLKAIADYCISGQYPDISRMCSTAVKITVRTLIHGHQQRMNSEYLRHYRQYVAAMAKKQEQAEKKK